MPEAAVLEFLQRTPARVGELSESLTPQELTLRPEGEIFSFVEHVWHLRDIESEGYKIRVQRMLAEDNPHLDDIDGTRLAAERNYNAREMSRGLEEFASARTASLSTLNGLTIDDMSRSGFLDGAGPVTIEELVALMNVHDGEHIEMLERLRDKLLALRLKRAN